MTGRYIVEALERGLKVLDLFSEPGTPGLRLTDISDRLGISKSLALRITSTLEAGGYLTRDAETKRYRLGVRLYQLGLAAEQNLDLRRIAQPLLRRLAEETRETVSLIAVDNAGPLCIDVIESPQGLRVFAQVGRRMPWHAGSSGKVVLAFLSQREQERILAGPFEKFTATTVTNPEQLRETLAEIRKNGFYVGMTDLDEHALGVAGPIFGHDGQVCGSVSVSAPTSRMSNQCEIDRMIVRVCETTAHISRQLGFGYGSPPDGADSPGS